MRRLALVLAPLALAACQDMRPAPQAGASPADTATSQAARSGGGMQGAGAQTGQTQATGAPAVGSSRR